MPSKIKALANKYMDGYELLAVENRQLTTDLTEQIYYEVKASDNLKLSAGLWILNRSSTGSFSVVRKVTLIQ